jgi:hypothetical protein
MSTIEEMVRAQYAAAHGRPRADYMPHLCTHDYLCHLLLIHGRVHALWMSTEESAREARTAAARSAEDGRYDEALERMRIAKAKAEFAAALGRAIVGTES